MNQREVRDVFEAAREARAELERRAARRAMIEALSVTSGIPQAIRGGGSDPTATAGQALADLDTADERGVGEALASRLDRARRLADGVGACLGDLAGTVLADYYLLGLEWKTVAHVNGVSKSTAFRLRDTAFDWIASVGEARAVLGVGTAEDA